MTTIRAILLFAFVLLVAACGSKDDKFKTYDGPEVTSLMLFKEKRTMHLLHGNQVVKTVPFELGFAPVGHKQIEGDGRTPEGTYRINRRNPNSAFHLSLGISYPSIRDVEVARAIGMSPGGDIFIHGTPRTVLGRRDWTAGCIAITDEEMEVVYAMVKDGTPIFIYP